MPTNKLIQIIKFRRRMKISNRIQCSNNHKHSTHSGLLITAYKNQYVNANYWILLFDKPVLNATTIILKIIYDFRLMFSKHDDFDVWFNSIWAKHKYDMRNVKTFETNEWNKQTKLWKIDRRAHSGCIQFFFPLYKCGSNASNWWIFNSISTYHRIIFIFCFMCRMPCAQNISIFIFFVETHTKTLYWNVHCGPKIKS